MAAALRVLGRNRFILSSKKKTLTLSLCTMPWDDEPHLEKDGWDFSLRLCTPPDCFRLSDFVTSPAITCNTCTFSIKHLDSGVKFSFNAYDALRKSLLEKSLRDPNTSDFPSYGSPLLSIFDYEYHSAYVGRVSIEKPGEMPMSITPTWEYIDWKTLHEQIVWTTRNEQISSVPSDCTYLNSDGPCSFVKPRKKANKPNRIGLLDPIVNFKTFLYHDMSTAEGGESFCDAYLVVTDCGWFFYLVQIFYTRYGDTRTREMTMHCNFKQNIVYREIVERQSKDFENRHSQVSEKIWKPKGDEMFLHFCEAKQLNIQEAYMGRPISCTVHDARRYIPFTADEWKKASPKALDGSGDKIELLFANDGERIRSVEEKLGARIQIVPLFRHPYNPKAPSKYNAPIPGKTPRIAYVLGSGNNIVPAKSLITMMNMPNLDDASVGTSQQ